MNFTPKAKRLVDSAVSELNRDAQKIWKNWAHNWVGAGHVPSDVANVAVDALSIIDARLQDYLANPSLDDDERADLINDLGYVRAVRTDLLGDATPRRLAAG